MTTTSTSPPAVDHLVRLPAVLARIPVSRATWLKGVREGRYPPAIRLGIKAAAWRSSDSDKLIKGEWEVPQ
ncbi:MAG: AlpA family phage regulatory protein [Pseudomonadota bacterium]